MLDVFWKLGLLLWTARHWCSVLYPINSNDIFSINWVMTSCSTGPKFGRFQSSDMYDHAVSSLILPRVQMLPYEFASATMPYPTLESFIWCKLFTLSKHTQSSSLEFIELSEYPMDGFCCL